ncbi:MAG: xanthine dehydrogenase family protein molybdopterin-binding subunit, partial [Chromatiales bacterium]|nr:xanthine dehydrogenase family protein molybdopterin-binding subunit [Chromatiales bacterium]
SITALAEIVHREKDALPAVWSNGLQAQASYDPPSSPVSSATHIVTVEVDSCTGAVHLCRYVVAEDCGPMIDEGVVEGQVRGAIAQAIGGTLYEEVQYSAEGQLLTGTLQDYLVPSIFDVPRIEIVHLCTPSPLTEGGYKGVAEGGTIGAPAAIVNAIADALGVLPDQVRLPLTPERVLALIDADKADPLQGSVSTRA